MHLLAFIISSCPGKFAILSPYPLKRLGDIMIASTMSGPFAGGYEGVDFDSSHRIIGALVDMLQNNFREDMRYKRPLMPPQANIIFALDGDVADNMIVYMSGKLREIGGFTEDEFHFTRKSSAGTGELQRLRLEFTTGVTAEIMRRIMMATDKLAIALTHNKEN
jgi:hypothetical protein